MVLSSSSRRFKGKLIALRAAQVAVSAVALFWSWFALAVAISEGVKSLPYAAIFVVPLAGLTLAVWKWPRVGGALMIVAGVIAFVFLAHPAPRLWMAAPAVIAGIVLLFVGDHGALTGKLPNRQ